METSGVFNKKQSHKKSPRLSRSFYLTKLNIMKNLGLEVEHHTQFWGNGACI